jgi:hypothetical protein
MIIAVSLHFQYYFRYIVKVRFIDGGNRKYPDTTTDLPIVTDKRYHIKLYRVNLSMNKIFQL